MTKIFYIAICAIFASCANTSDTGRAISEDDALRSIDSLRCRADSLVEAARTMPLSAYRHCFEQARICRAKALDIARQLQPPLPDSTDIAELHYLDSRIAMLDSLDRHLILD